MKKFTLTVTDNGEMVNFDSTNEGFTTLELIGMLELKQRDILKQVEAPAEFARKVVKPDGTVQVIEG